MSERDELAIEHPPSGYLYESEDGFVALEPIRSPIYVDAGLKETPLYPAAAQDQLRRGLGELATARQLLAEVDQVCRDSFRDAGTVQSHRTVPVCPLCDGEAVCDEDCPAPDIRRFLASSPLTALTREGSEG